MTDYPVVEMFPPAPIVPMPGDAVLVTEDLIGVQAGQIGILEGTVGEARDSYLVCFHYSAFRGTNIGGVAGKEYVSCSGGPAWYIDASDLEDTGHYRTVNFWRWQDMPRRDGGEHYQLSVRVWKLNTKKGTDNGNQNA